MVDVTGGLGVLIDGNPANMTLSIGHVVRDNSVRGHRAPPTQFSNFDGAITVGVDAVSPTCGCKISAAHASQNKPAGTCCFGSVKAAITGVVVEGNRVVAEGAGACPVAAAMAGMCGPEARKIVCVVSGGGLDTKHLVSILNRDFEI